MDVVLVMATTGKSIQRGWKGCWLPWPRLKLSTHLRQYVFHDCGVSKEQVRKMVDRHGFTNIKDIYAYYS
jgi:hypothetical protein